MIVITITSMIYTLGWLEKEANLITGYWNGGDEKFVDGSGEVRTEDDVLAAEDLLTKISEIKELIKELGI